MSEDTHFVMLRGGGMTRGCLCSLYGKLLYKDMKPTPEGSFPGWIHTICGGFVDERYIPPPGTVLDVWWQRDPALRDLRWKWYAFVVTVITALVTMAALSWLLR